MPEQAPDIEFGRGKLRYDKERRTIVAEGPMDVNSPEAARWSEGMRLKSENEALRAVVVDMLSGLAYLRSTKSAPYGFGIDRLEQTGNAALGNKSASP